MKNLIVSQYQRIKALYVRYERWLMPLMLLGGFLLDYFTFTSITISTTFILLFGYWILVGAVIAFTHLYDAQKLPWWLQFKYVRLFSPLLIQFAFGSLLGSSLIFYWFSGAFAISWPVMAILVLLLVFNETFRKYFEKPLVHLGVYYFATLSLFSVWLPFLFNSLSAWLFVAAGAGSVVIFGAYIHYLCRFAGHLQAQKKWFFVSMIAIAAMMNVLYFTNIIPPIPLALREAGLYHGINTFVDKYVMTAELENFLQAAQAMMFGQTLHVIPGEKIYLYTAIFAPANLETTIVHRWQYYDAAQKKWVDRGKLLFAINGGRKDGYKGYSWQTDLAAGSWRVYVQNQRGQILARVRFNVERVAKPAALEQVVR